MTEKILSQEEIDNLLLSIVGEQPIPDYARNVGEKRLSIVDFRSHRFRMTKRQITALQHIHEDFARHAAVWLTQKTGADTSLFVGSVDQLTYEEFLRCLPGVTNCMLFAPRPLLGEAIMAVPSTVAFVALDLMLGGSGAPRAEIRTTTDVETSVLEGVAVGLLGWLRTAWARVADLRPSLGNIESQPQLLRATLPPETRGVLISIEARVGDAEDFMHVWYSYVTLEPLLGVLDNRNVGIAAFPEIPLDFPIRVSYGLPDVFLPMGELPFTVGDVVVGLVPGLQLRAPDGTILHKRP